MTIDVSNTGVSIRRGTGTNPGQLIALIEIEPGGLLFDEGSGGFVVLNQTATFVWRQHLAGLSLDEVAGSLSAQYRISRQDARRDVGIALDLSSVGGNRPAHPSDLSYERTTGGYSVFRSDQTLFDIDEKRRELCWRHDPRPSKQEAEALLQWMAPKLLSLCGYIVLHSSAVLMKDGVVAFSGHGGAGKTTSAQMLARKGAQLVSEDKLLVRVTENQAEAYLEAEGFIRAWSKELANKLMAGGLMSFGALTSVTEGPTAPLREVGFIAAARRVDGAPDSRRLSLLEGASALFSNAFYGSNVTEDWPRRLQCSAEISKRIATFELTMARGLPQLAAALEVVFERGSLSKT